MGLGSHSRKQTWLCPICYYPRSDGWYDGRTTDLCECCGIDSSAILPPVKSDNLSQVWIDDGGPWRGRKRPEGWTPDEQIARLKRRLNPPKIQQIIYVYDQEICYVTGDDAQKALEAQNTAFSILATRSYYKEPTEEEMAKWVTVPNDEEGRKKVADVVVGSKDV